MEIKGPGFDHITAKLKEWIDAQRNGEALPWRFSPEDLGVMCLMDDAEMKQPGIPRRIFRAHIESILREAEASNAYRAR